jgi:hypothetical protein
MLNEILGIIYLVAYVQLNWYYSSCVLFARSTVYNQININSSYVITSTALFIMSTVHNSANYF